MDSSIFENLVVNSMARLLKADRFCRDESYRERFLAGIHRFVDHMEEENLEAMQARKSSVMNREESYAFFRGQERIRQTKLVLQYLLAFVDDHPWEREVNRDLVDPLNQFRDFARYLVDLLQKPDVNSAITQGFSASQNMTGNTEWYYRGKIQSLHQRLCQEIRESPGEPPNVYSRLFGVLIQLSVFWFRVRNQNPRLLRKSDGYIFVLALYLKWHIEKSPLREKPVPPVVPQRALNAD